MNTGSEAVERGERLHLGPLIAWSVVALLQVGLGIFAMVMREDVDAARNPLFTTEFVFTSVVIYAILILLAIGIAGKSSLDSRRMLGFRRFEARWLGAGAGVIVAALVVGMLMSVFGNAAEEQGLSPDRWEPGKEVVFAAAAVVVILVVPFAEELFFRGLGVGVLAFAGPAVAIAVPGIAFALAHGLLIGLPPLLVLGAGLAWIRYRSESVWPCFIAHAAWNGLALAVAAAVSF